MVRNDLFLIKIQEGYYQRPGNFLFMQFMIICSLVALLSCFQVYAQKWIIFVSLILLLLNALSSMVLAQLIGSNSGFYSIAGFTFMLFSYLYVSSKPGLEYGMQGIGFKTIFFGWIGKRLLISLFIISILFFIIISLIIDKFQSVGNLFRFTGFGSNTIISITSRYEIFFSNFVEHFNYNPIFGNSQVDVLTTGEGTYLHSIFSILTHHGLIGFFLFSCFIFQMYKEISKTYVGRDTLYNDNRYSIFRILSLGLVLIYALLIAFYTWMPLWFAIGLLGFRFPGNTKHRLYRQNYS
jgi:hypothetical protein